MRHIWLQRRERGFSLIELLVVIVIIGILAAIAIPNYNEYIRKARRSDAKSALTTQAQRAERHYTENATYATFTLSSATSPDGYYTIGLCDAAGAVVAPSATTYSICATPTGAQTGDTCGIMSINQQGVRSPASGCW
ncbi:MAG: prepilin-type N-terminal cleavage/methylation domain-containing protein [Betaproteobacteria bacterium]|nr:prepilin-type N-terminal cleavage/methylation domain-containing protein [Betaproteobacteria bacterium]